MGHSLDLSVNASLAAVGSVILQKLQVSLFLTPQFQE